MSPNAPAATPLTINPNLPYAGQSQATNDYGTASNLLSFLPQQENQTAKVNPSDTSILPNVNANYSIVNAPTAQTINPASFGNNQAAYNEAVQKSLQGLTGQENNSYNQALQQYQQNINQFGNLTGVYNNLANTYNIPGYQKDVNVLQGLLENLNQDVNAQTTLGGGLMTQAARDEVYANRQQPLSLALSNASRELETGQSNVQNLMQAYETSLQNALKPEEMNIQSLPTLFQQTNEAAQGGYNQGATAIQNAIQNQQEQQRIGLQAQANALTAKQINAEYGTGAGNIASAFGGGNTSQAIPGVQLKSPQLGAAGGYAFQLGNKPASAASWAASNANLWGNGTSAIQAVGTTIQNMAQSGDVTAQAAFNEISKNNGQITKSIISKYPSLFWGWMQ